MSARFLILWFSLTVAASLVSRAQLRAGSQDRCALDGAAIRPTARVDLLEGTKQSRSFCSVECALAWPRSDANAAWPHFQVHAEADARPLDSRAAFFVRSNLRPGQGRSVLRAFADALSATEHARAFGGALVPNPFLEHR